MSVLFVYHVSSTRVIGAGLSIRGTPGLQYDVLGLTFVHAAKLELSNFCCLVYSL